MSYSPSNIVDLTRAAFRQEAEDLLAELDSALLQLEASPTDGDSLNRAFRAMHTLKGSGATAGFTEVSAVVHDVEDIFNGAREGRIRITSPIIDLVLKSGDVVRRMLSASKADGARLLDEGMKVAAELKSLVGPAAAAAAVVATPTRGAAAFAETKVEAGLWAIHFAPDARILQTGNDPLNLLRELLSLGQGVVRARTERLFAEEEIDAELCYLSWDIQLATSETKARLKDVFLFVEDESDLRIEEVAPGEAWILPAEAYFDASTIKEFREEASEDVAEIEAHVLALEESPSDPARFAGLKRTLHNLKGVCRLVLSDVRRAPPPRHPLRAMSEVCHSAESFLEARPGGSSAPLDEGASEALLLTADWLKSLLRALDEGLDEWPTDLLERLGAGASEPGEPGPSRRVVARPMVVSIVDQCDDVMRAIDARPGPAAPPSRVEWQALARVLETLAKATSFEGATGAAVKVRELAAICVAGAAGTATPSAWEGVRARYVDARAGLSAPTEVAPPSLRHRARTISLRPSQASVSVARPAQVGAAAAEPLAPRSLRVDQAKLDVLMGAIGELLVAKNALPVIVARVRASDRNAGKEVKETMDRIARIADDLQDAMRQIRMMPVRSVFQRFPRMIRDLARSENKQVQLIISGDDIELDKTVLEQIGDPLVHLVRNAVDHGIELPEQRRLQGKPEMGTVGLEVLKEGTNVVLRISDDGRGMDPKRLRAKAVEKGLLSEAEAAVMPDARAFELIFLPGFSTAEKVTDLSGRGVGMDVVRSNVRQLRGEITLASELGRGSVMSITLPQSLMVSKGMLVECASEQYVLPIEGVREMVKLRREQIREFRGVAMTSIRGSVCPVYSLSRLLGLDDERDGEHTMTAEEANAVILGTGGAQVAVLVDRFVAEIDVIVKPLSRGLDKLLVFQGAAILGDGTVALILDIGKLDALIALASRGSQGEVDAAA